jgi:hypothetical protein
MFNVITSFNQKYWEEVAQQSSFFLDKLWTPDAQIFLYHELNDIPNNLNFSNRMQWVDFHKNCPQWQEFANRWKNEPKANGGDGLGGNFKLDAIKFTHKTFAIWDLYKKLPGGWLVWIDCDAFLYNPIDEHFINEIFKSDKMIAYVGRPGRLSECGFLAFNLDHGSTRKFLTEWEEIYTSGEFVNLPETHDSWTFDYLRLKWNNPELFYNLNSDADSNKNPFSKSKLKNYFVHAKGSDKMKTMNKLKKNFKI